MTAHLSAQKQNPLNINMLRGLFVGVAGFEPTTSSSRTTRATKLRYTPVRWAKLQNFTNF
jgi:hypothetical protein